MPPEPPFSGVSSFLCDSFQAKESFLDFNNLMKRSHMFLGMDLKSFSLELFTDDLKTDLIWSLIQQTCLISENLLKIKLLRRKQDPDVGLLYVVSFAVAGKGWVNIQRENNMYWLPSPVTSAQLHTIHK